MTNENEKLGIAYGIALMRIHTLTTALAQAAKDLHESASMHKAASKTMNRNIAYERFERIEKRAMAADQAVSESRGESMKMSLALQKELNTHDK